MVAYTMKTKENFSRYQVFCISLADELRKSIHPSLDVYVVKDSGRIHLTSQVDLDCLLFQISNLVNYHLFHHQNFEYLDYNFVQQKGYQYNYILFDYV